MLPTGGSLVSHISGLMVAFCVMQGNISPLEDSCSVNQRSIWGPESNTVQAREDAKAGIALLLAAPQRRPVCCEVPHQEQLGLAYAALGDAYMAEHQHADKECSHALRVKYSLHLCSLSVLNFIG